MAPEFVADRIRAGYAGVAVVKGISLSVDRTQIAVVLGPNGAGKSTLVKALVGLVPKSAGTVLLQGEDISGLPTEQLISRGVAYVPQLHAAFETLTVMENLEMGGYSLRTGVRNRAEELLELFPVLRTAARRTASTLSGGEHRMLALARGLMPSPRVLIADEPTAALSPQAQDLVWEHLTNISQGGVAVLVVEQNVTLALQHADWAYVMVLGEVRLQGPADEVAAGGELTALYIGGRSAPSVQTVQRQSL